MDAEAVQCCRTNLDLNPRPSTSSLCDPGLVASPLWLFLVLLVVCPIVWKPKGAVKGPGSDRGPSSTFPNYHDCFPSPAPISPSGFSKSQHSAPWSGRLEQLKEERKA